MLTLFTNLFPASSSPSTPTTPTTPLTLTTPTTPLTPLPPTDDYVAQSSVLPNLFGDMVRSRALPEAFRRWGDVVAASLARVPGSTVEVGRGGRVEGVKGGVEGTGRNDGKLAHCNFNTTNHQATKMLDAIYSITAAHPHPHHHDHDHDHHSHDQHPSPTTPISADPASLHAAATTLELHHPRPLALPPSTDLHHFYHSHLHLPPFRSLLHPADPTPQPLHPHHHVFPYAPAPELPAQIPHTPQGEVAVHHPGVPVFAREDPTPAGIVEAMRERGERLPLERLEEVREMVPTDPYATVSPVEMMMSLAF
ncbi:hypothetical protein HDU96_007615 [Phlyctochytrium bullatum]|nr:hypothetical protein HDU96_007615 [Phlyctochytrium bullatum]